MKKVFITGLQIMMSAIVLAVFFLFTNYDHIISYLTDMSLTGILLYLIWETKLIDEKAKREEEKDENCL